MGNAQQGQRRGDRFDAGGGRRGTAYSEEDQRPFELRINRPRSSPSASTHSMQYMDTTELPVVFKWKTSAKAVLVSGSWDGWRKKIPMVKSREDFTTIINLPEGHHEFKYMVDNQWMCDDTSQKTTNEVGTENNVIDVRKEDFDVTDALDRDLQASLVEQAARTAKTGAQPATTSDYSAMMQVLSTGGDFGQEIPQRKKPSEGEATPRPPTLPPHLLQVVLNKDTPISCDPNVLPEPNHVMLNHLYALSIKDGVMVLSATHRYRKKYVTTLLYKPIAQ